MKERRLFQKSDLFLVAALIILAVISSVVFTVKNRGKGEAYCQITYEGNLALTVDLSKDGAFALEQNPNVLFEVNNGAIAFIESNCPDKVCIHSGFLSNPGQMAACLPNRVSIRIISEEADTDMIAY